MRQEQSDKEFTVDFPIILSYDPYNFGLKHNAAARPVSNFALSLKCVIQKCVSSSQSSKCLAF